MVRYKVFATFIISALILFFPTSASAVSFNVNSTITQTFWNAQMRSKWSDSSLGWSSIGATNQTSCSRDNLGSCLPVMMQFYDSGQHIVANSGDIFEIILGGRVKFTFGNWQNVGNSNFEVLDIVQRDTWADETSNSNIRSASYSTIHVIVRAKSNGVWLELGNGFNNIFNMPFSSTSNQAPEVVYFLLTVNKLKVQSVVNAETMNTVNNNQLTGQNNIENQNTSGKDQGVSNDKYSSLLDIFTGFITAISGVSPGSCSISLDTNVGNLGEVDFCALEPPSWVQVVGSIIVILLFVPCSMALINRILKIIQEMQR